MQEIPVTPSGSGSSIQFDARITSAAPGSADGLYLIVSDIEAARAELAAHGAEVSEVFSGDAFVLVIHSRNLDD